MSRVRLLPIVIVAASGLFILKTAELVTSGQALFAQTPQKKITREEDLPSFARALARHRFTPPPAEDGDITGAVPAKKDEKKDEKKPDAAKAGDAKAQQVAQAAPSAAMPPPVQPLPPSSSPSERAILERLQERRGAIDERQREMELRENMLKAAERKVDGRIGELKEIEDRLTASQRAEKEEADKQMKMVVLMYETMKPKDAARVFDRLNLSVLVPIATAMNPRKMAEILAAMTPESAEKLTVALAMRSRDSGAAANQSAAGPQGELPRIDQPPAAVPPRQVAPPPPRR